MMRGIGRQLVACVSLSVLGLAAQAQNLLSNPNFRNNLGSWLDGSDAFVHDDSLGSPAAGSARGTDPAGGDCVSLWQCGVPATPGRIYRFGGLCRLPPGAGGTSSCYATLNFYPGANCQGGLGYVYSQPVNWPGNWASFQDSAVAPEGTVSQGLKLSVCNNDAAGMMTANIDSAYILDQGEPPGRGDFDRNGFTDLVLQNTVDRNTRIWFMRGVERQSSELVSPATTGVLVVGSEDIDGDNYSDLIVRNAITGVVEFWRMKGATRVGAPLALTGATSPSWTWTLMASADFNNDGHVDLLWRNRDTNALLIWTMDGAAKVGTLTPSPAQATDANWSVAAAMDFDRDNDTDLLWYNSTSGKIVLWHMDDNVVRVSGEFTSPDSAGGSNWKVMAAGDYSGHQSWMQSSRDVVWRNSTSGKFVVWHMDPATVPLTRTSGEFTNPDGPNVANPTEWTIVGPK